MEHNKIMNKSRVLKVFANMQYFLKSSNEEELKIFMSKTIFNESNYGYYSFEEVFKALETIFVK